MKRKNRSITSIAATLDRSASTISREIARNSNPDGSYSAGVAQKRFAARAAAASCRASRVGPERWEYVEKHLTQDQWSPEQISGRMGRDGLKPISPEGIYQYILRDKVKGRSLHSHLRHKLRSYRRRGSPRERRGRIPLPADDCGEAAGCGRAHPLRRLRDGHRHRPAFGGNARHQRRAAQPPHPRAQGRRQERPCGHHCHRHRPAALPGKHIHTLTYDNGKEFALHKLIDTVLGGTGYFANPYHSWERGLNENTNGLIRQYFPKRTDFGKVSESELREVQDKLNKRPRKCLGWRTPNEIFSDQAAIVALPS